MRCCGKRNPTIEVARLLFPSLFAGNPFYLVHSQYRCVSDRKVAEIQVPAILRLQFNCGVSSIATLEGSL